MVVGKVLECKEHTTEEEEREREREHRAIEWQERNLRKMGKRQKNQLLFY